MRIYERPTNIRPGLIKLIDDCRLLKMRKYAYPPGESEHVGCEESPIKAPLRTFGKFLVNGFIVSERKTDLL